MKRLLMVIVIITMFCSTSVLAITTGKWDFSSIPSVIQNVAKDIEKEPDKTKTEIFITDSLLEQIYAAKQAQYRVAIQFWESR